MLNKKTSILIGIIIAIFIIVGIFLWQFLKVETPEKVSEKPLEVSLITRKLGTIPEEIDYKIKFSSNGQHFAYRVEKEGKHFVVLDGKETGPYDWIGVLPVFNPNPNSQHFAYRVEKEGKWFVILDGKEIGPYDHVEFLTFSPNDQYFAYDIKKEGKWFVVLDGKEIGPYDSNSTFSDIFFPPFSFDSESKCLYYGALIGRELWWRVEKVE